MAEGEQESGRPEETQDEGRDGGPSLRSRAWPWWLVGAIVLYELTAHAVIVSRVPAEADWEQAAAAVREAHEPGDVILIAPAWADPILRLHLGDLLPIPVAGRSDLAPFARAWELSLRGRRGEASALGRPAAFEQRYGRITVRRFDLGPSSVRVDLTSRVREAEVSRAGRACAWRRTISTTRSGLGGAQAMPSEHFFCGPEPWLWVGETVMEDLELQPRHCVWQHPAGGEPIVTTFRDVELAERVVFYAGLHYEHERSREHGPVHARIFLDDRELAHMEHRDGDGWKRVEAAIPRQGRGDLRIEVSAPSPHLRTFCWAATLRGPAREVGE
ncbi:MAG: hypothetical protein KF901_30145 [Myxococcales bacterium]|nr:hypothetical protein [Myxococcales bacterium]